MDVAALRKEYAIQRAIDDRLDDVIGIVKKVQDIKGITSAQLSNLLTTAKETDSVQVVIAWIQYQMGRARAPISGPKGNTLITAIQADMRQFSQDIVQEVKGNERDTLRIWAQLVRLYLGHLKRHFTYLEYLEKQKRLQQQRQGGRRESQRR